MSPRRSPRLAAVAAAIALALAAAAPAAAVPCALDEPPAATLLLPYFEVDLDGSATTLLSVASAAPAGTLTRVTLWSDLGVPVFWFDVYLTGWDVQTINLRDVLHGHLPQTAPPAADPGDHISPRGDLSFETDFPGCAETMPPADLGAGLAAHLRAALSGQPSPLEPELCYGIDHGDGLARGWATIDVVDECDTFPPGHHAVFDPPLGNQLAMDNVLWGDFLLVDPPANRASAANLVRLEAAPEVFGADDATFYSNKLGSGADAREPLPTVWAARYLDSSTLSGGSRTDILYWRDPGEPSHPFACGERGLTDLMAAFPWFPAADPDVIAFDEEENAQTGFGCSQTACPPPHPLDDAFFPSASGRASLRFDLPVAFAFGWLYLDLDLETEPAQAWVGSLVQADDRYSAALEATPLDAPCAPGRPALDDD